MGTWIEIRCEDRTEEWAEGRPNERCWSNDNAGPMDMAGDTLASVKGTIADLRKDALVSGWRMTRSGWICPHCAIKRPAGRLSNET